MSAPSVCMWVCILGVHAHAVVCTGSIAYGFQSKHNEQDQAWKLVVFEVGSRYNDNLVSTAARRCIGLSQIKQVELTQTAPTHPPQS